MPSNEKTLEVLLKLKDKFSTRFAKATGKMVAGARQMGRGAKFALKPIAALTKSFFSWRTAILATATAFATLHTAGKFVSAAGEFETYATQLRILSTDQAEAAKTFERFKGIAAESPLDTSDFLKAFVQLQAVGVEAAESTVQKLGDVAVLFNRQVSDIGAAFIGLEAEVLRRLGVTLDRTGAKAILTSGNIRVETTKDIATIREALLDLWARRFPGAMDKAKDTYQAKLNTMAGAWTLFMAETGDALLPFTKRAMDGVTEFLNRHRDLVAGTLKDEEVFFDLLKEHGAKVFAELSLEVMGIMKDLSLSLAEIAGSFWEPFKAASVRPMVGLGIDAWEKLAEEMLKDSDDDIFAEFWRKQLETAQKSRPVLTGLIDLRVIDETTKAFTTASKRIQLNVRDKGERIDGLAKKARAARAIIEEASNVAPFGGSKPPPAFDPQTPAPSFPPITPDESAFRKAKAENDEFIESLRRSQDAAAYGWANLTEGALHYADAIGAAYTAALKLQQTQDQDARRDELRSEARQILAGLRTEEQLYADALQFANTALEANAITLQEWGQLSDAARAKVEEFRAAQAAAAAEQQARARGFLGGFQQESDRIEAELRDTFESGAEMANSMAFAFDSAFSRAFDDLIAGTGSVKGAFKSMAASILSDLSRIIARQLIIKPLLAGLFGGGGGGGLLGGLIPKLDHGGVVQGPALVQVGAIRERVSFEPLTGPGARGGGAGGQTTIIQNFNMSGVDGPSIKRMTDSPEFRLGMRKGLIDDMGRRPDIRNAVKGATL